MNAESTSNRAETAGRIPTRTPLSLPPSTNAPGTARRNAKVTCAPASVCAGSGGPGGVLFRSGSSLSTALAAC